MCVGEKICLQETVKMLPWRILLLAKSRSDRNRLLSPVDLEHSFKVNPSEYPEFMLFDALGIRSKKEIYRLAESGRFPDANIYDCSAYPELHVEKAGNGKIMLCSFNASAGKNTIMNVPGISLKSDNEEVVRVTTDNQLQALAAGEANVYCVDNKYKWHLVVTDEAISIK
jgi:hypothetical protein